MSQLSFSEKRLSAIVEKAVNNAFAAQKAVLEPTHPEEYYLPSIVALCDFLECSYPTGKRLKKEGFIKFTQEGTKVKFLISDVLDAIEKYDRVGKYIDRMMEKYPPAGAPSSCNSSPIREILPHKIFIESELYDDIMFIDIKYRGFKCIACCSADLWDKQSEIKSLVNLIIERQNQRKPFKTTSNESN